MLNQVILVGTITKKVIDENTITLLINRRDDGYDEIKVDIVGLLSSKELIKIGTTVGVKARLRIEEGKLNVIAEKLTFINKG